MILLAKISAACALALPFLGAAYQLLLGYLHGQDRGWWKAAGAIALAALLIFVGWTKLIV